MRGSVAQVAVKGCKGCRVMLRNDNERPQNRPRPRQLAGQTASLQGACCRATPVRFISARWRGKAAHGSGGDQASPLQHSSGPRPVLSLHRAWAGLPSEEPPNSSSTSAAQKGAKPTWLHSGRCSALKHLSALVPLPRVLTPRATLPLLRWVSILTSSPGSPTSCRGGRRAKRR